MAQASSAQNLAKALELAASACASAQSLSNRYRNHSKIALEIGAAEITRNRCLNRWGARAAISRIAGAIRFRFQPLHAAHVHCIGAVTRTRCERQELLRHTNQCFLEVPGIDEKSACLLSSLSQNHFISSFFNTTIFNSTVFISFQPIQCSTSFNARRHRPLAQQLSWPAHLVEPTSCQQISLRVISFHLFSTQPFSTQPCSSHVSKVK